METKIQNSLSDLSHNEILQLDRDYVEAAKMAKLRYVTDSNAGIHRQRRGKGFVYYGNDVVIKDEATLDRIRKLVIPPAWERVWICPFANGHIQATGIDARGRKQYKYHVQWSALRNETKFHRLYEFGKALPSLRMQVEKDLSRRDLSQQRVLATVVSLMERTYIRIGNEDYNKLYGSHGMTTLKDNHVEVTGSVVKFCFTGKRGIRHTISLKSRRLSRIVQQCKDIPGKELFQFLDEKGNRQTVDSGMVNDYIKETSEGEFTAKDFRTWAGTLNLLRSFRSIGEAITETECKRNIVKALDEVSLKLGNTRTVCKKYYVHPGLIELYEKNNLSRYLKELDEIEEPDMKADLTSDEKILMRILKTLH